MELHFLNVLMSLIDELSSWDWNSTFHPALTAYFFLGCIPQFILLKKNKFAWVPIVALFVGVVACEITWLFVSGQLAEAVNVIEAFLYAASFGAVGGCCAYFFWELFKRREDPTEPDDRWMLTKNKK